VSLFGERHAFSDVDKAGAADSAAAYLQGVADQFHVQRLEDLDALDLRAGSTFLDAGCGLGDIVLEVATRVAPGGSAVGVDFSGELIERAGATADAQRSDAHFEVGDVTRLRFDDASFDAVRCSRVFQHLEDTEADAAVAEFVRVTKPGGRILLVDAIQARHVVDCGDMEVFEAILDRLASHVRDPYAGIRLARRLQTANVTLKSFEAFLRLIPFQVWSHALGIDDHLAALVANGDVTERRAQAFIDDLAEREANGSLYAAASGARALAVKG